MTISVETRKFLPHGVFCVHNQGFLLEFLTVINAEKLECR